MDILVTPKPLSGIVTVPASKSDLHRALICAALSQEPTTISSDKTELVAVAHDVLATERCLEALGATFDKHDDHLTVHPIPRGTLPLGHVELDGKSSGSTVRFLLPITGVLADSATFTGTEQLTKRPLGDLMVAMHDHGTRFVSASGNAPKALGPLTAGGGRATLRNLELPIRMVGRLEPGDYEIPGDVSSQYVSGLLFGLALLTDLTQRSSTLTLTSQLEAAGYVGMTIDWLERFGVSIEPELGYWTIPAGTRFVSPGHVKIEGDWSSGAVLLALTAFNKNNIKVRGLKASSRQPDRMIQGFLPEWLGVRKNRAIDTRDLPDLFPILSLLAAAPVDEEWDGPLPVTTFTAIDRLRYKDSTRVATTIDALRAAGVRVDTTDKELRIEALRGPQPSTPIEVDAAGDHRLVLAATLAAHVFSRPALIKGAEAVEKSYPIFFEDYRKLGGSAEIVAE